MRQREPMPSGSRRVSPSHESSFPLQDIEALGMDLLRWNPQRGQYLFHRVHHGRRSAHEILIPPVLLRQITAQHISIDEPRLTLPPFESFFKHIDDLQV